MAVFLRFQRADAAGLGVVEAERVGGHVSDERYLTAEHAEGVEK
jgi:hypothetical protein